jgi:hypothetical protein
VSFTSFEAAQRRASLEEAKRNCKASDMVLRDYFAAKAMTSLYLSGLEWEPTGKPRDPAHRAILEELAVDAYQFADAMLKARNGNS